MIGTRHEWERLTRRLLFEYFRFKDAYAGDRQRGAKRSSGTLINARARFKGCAEITACVIPGINTPTAVEMDIASVCEAIGTRPGYEVSRNTDQKSYDETVMRGLIAKWGGPKA